MQVFLAVSMTVAQYKTVAYFMIQHEHFYELLQSSTITNSYKIYIYRNYTKRYIYKVHTAY